MMPADAVFQGALSNMLTGTTWAALPLLSQRLLTRLTISEPSGKSCCAGSRLSYEEEPD